MDLTIVSTLYRSAPHLREFYARVSHAAAAITPHYEIVLVNDGSPDESLGVARQLVESDPRVRVVDLARNFGHHKAMMTGLSYAGGSRVFLIDCDLEEDPELLAEFDQRMQASGADVVYGVQAQRRGDMVERLSGWLFFASFNALSPHELPANVLTVRLMTRRYVEALLRHQERETIIAGLWAITGFEQLAVTVAKHARNSTTYSLRRKVAILVNSVTSFSDAPLVMVFYLGLGISLLAIAAAAYLLVRRLFFGVLLAGWPSLIVSVWLLGGLTLFCLGILGIYLSKIFIETKQRPYTIVRDVYERRE
ncbi:MAG TPA: glycosyltransferase family 2 protein [Vicinamibacterales bacterium]